jgi:hypothetical protein
MPKNNPFFTLFTGAILGIILLGVIYWFDKIYETPNGFPQFSKNAFCAIAYLQLFFLGVRWVFAREDFYGEKEMSLINWILAGFGICFFIFLIFSVLFFNGALDSFYDDDYLKFKNEIFAKMNQKNQLTWQYYVELCRFLVALLFFVPKIRKSIPWTIAICLVIISWYLFEWFFVLLPSYMTPNN